MVLEFHNDITAGNVLVREAIQSQNYVAGTTGWQIAQDGSAQFNNVSILGSLSTGPAGTDHVEVPNGLAEVDFVLGVNGAEARALTTQVGAGVGAVANINLESSPHTAPGNLGGIQTRNVVSLRGGSGFGSSALGAVKTSDGVTLVGGRVQANLDGSATLDSVDSSGNGITGSGFMNVSDAGFSLGVIDATQDTIITGLNGGIEGWGNFPHASNVFPVFTPLANWTVTSFDLSVWGPFCLLNLGVTRNAAAIAAGVGINAVGTLSFSTADTALPKATTVGAAASGNAPGNAGTGFISTIGAVTLSWTAAGLAVGANIRLCIPYFKA